MRLRTTYVKDNEVKLNELIIQVSCIGNATLKHVMEGKIERGKTRKKTYKQLLDGKENRKYWNLKVNALYRTLLINHIDKCYGPVVRLATL
jgi:predicted transcriptional regulator